MKTAIKTECSSCGATGLYEGFAEKSGTAVVCLSCDGTGCRVVEFTPFTERKPKRGVETVSRSRGSFIATGVGAAGESITYAEFAKGKMP